MSFAFEYKTTKIPSQADKQYVGKVKCPLIQEDLLKRQPDSLIKMLDENSSLKGFYNNLRQINQEFQRYSQAKKIQLLLLYYIKKYNNKDTPHARDCVEYIFGLNEQKNWLNIFDLNFVYGFAFDNGIYEIVNKEIKEHLELNIDGNPLKYAVNKCDNILAEWLINNVFSGLKLKDNQFKYIYDAINKKNCFNSTVITLFNNYYNMYDNPKLKSLELEINRGIDINALKTGLINLYLQYINTNDISEKTILGKQIMHIIKRIIKKDNKVFYNDILPELIAKIASKNYKKESLRRGGGAPYKYTFKLIKDNYIFVKYIIDNIPPISSAKFKDFSQDIDYNLDILVREPALRFQGDKIESKNITDYVINELIKETSGNCIIS